MLQMASCAFIQFSSIHATNLNEYLNEKLQQSKIEFIKIHIQETSPGKFVMNLIFDGYIFSKLIILKIFFFS